MHTITMAILWLIISVGAIGAFGFAIGHFVGYIKGIDDAEEQHKRCHRENMNGKPYHAPEGTAQR
jgi:hypothetical protein